MAYKTNIKTVGNAGLTARLLDGDPSNSSGKLLLNANSDNGQNVDLVPGDYAVFMSTPIGKQDETITATAKTVRKPVSERSQEFTIPTDQLWVAMFSFRLTAEGNVQ